jgi:glutathione reductase (NADPH)
MPIQKVDLFVIGGGSGGVRAARIASSYGAKTMLAEEFRMGGTCVIRGCVPKKLYVYASRFADDFESAKGFGWDVITPNFNWQTLVAAKEKEITRLEGIYTKTQANAGVTVIKSRAILKDSNTVQLLNTGELVEAKHILIATGGKPNLPDIAGIEHAITSNEAFDLPKFPKRIIIAGGGYIAVEFAGIFAGLGADVTLIYRGSSILRGFDEDMSNGLLAAYQKQGIKFIFNDVFSSIEKTPNGLIGHTKAGLALPADQIMFAIGRAPNSHCLGLEELGVDMDSYGAIKVDEYSRTNIPNIYAVGDVTNRVALTPVAIREGHAVADNLFGGKDIKIDYSNIPTAVFSTPEIGTVGLSEKQACEQFAQVDVYKASFRPMSATISGKDSQVIMKLLVDAQTDKILGAHVLGDGAGEMAQLLGVILKMGGKKSDFDNTMALHPSSAEEMVTMRTPFARRVR